MGVGKSTVGRRASSLLGLDFVDMDSLVEERAGVSVAEIFAKEGETGFREREAKLLSELLDMAKQRSLLIATGGGVVTFGENIGKLTGAGIRVVYMHAAPAVLYGRLMGDRRRPLLQNTNPREALERLYLVRHPLYLRAATDVLEVDSRLATTTNKLIELIKQS
jgi:shikimate kinase